MVNFMCKNKEKRHYNAKTKDSEHNCKNCLFHNATFGLTDSTSNCCFKINFFDFGNNYSFNSPLTKLMTFQIFCGVHFRNILILDKDCIFL
jgi:hypothetical protein